MKAFFKKNWAPIGLLCLCVIILLFSLWRLPEELQQEQARVKKLENEESYRQLLESADSMIAGTATIKLPLPTAHMMRAYALLMLDEKEKALQEYKLTKEQWPQEYGKTSHLNFLAWRLVGLGQYDDGVRIWEESLKDFPDDKAIAAAYGQFLYATKNDALRDPKRAVEILRPNAHSGETSVDLKLFSQALAANGDFESAIKYSHDASAKLEQEHKKRLEAIDARMVMLKKHGVISPQLLENEEKNRKASETSFEKQLLFFQRSRESFLEKKALPHAKEY